jgi:phosphomannomutase
MSDPILEKARTHLSEDPDADHRAELSSLLEQAEGGDAEALADLGSRFGSGLTFGTAGLRGAIGPGTARMNRVVVLKACWGFGQYLLEHVDNAKERGVLIAFDGRRYSRQFAEDSAACLAAMGIKAHLFDDPAPTPLAAFAVTHLKAAGGIMVTASHNPPADNGYKVYWENGAQIIPPQDEGIAAHIAKAPRCNDIARLAPNVAAREGLRVGVPDSVTAAYLDGVAAGCMHPYAASLAAGAEPLNVVYTAMHGVGHHSTIRALRRAGIEGVAIVPEQTDPDGMFPTVSFPNPEEPGALDRAMALADDSGAEIIVAQDPDADRLAVALRPAPGQPFERLSGNAIGVLLGADAIEHADIGDHKPLVCTTIVSSTMLSRIARDLGAEYEETLTGFKWIANTSVRRMAEGNVTFVLGYEEALGYSVGPLVRDKDGVSAVVRILELAAFLKSQGKTLLQRLDELAVAHGLSEDLQWSVVLPGDDGKARIEGAMQKLRDEPPTTLGGEEVVKRRDLDAGIVIEGDKETRIEGPGSNVLSWWTRSGLRLTARPSGTEPKIKFYLDANAKVGSTDELADARGKLKEQLAQVKDEVMARVGL